MINFIYKVNNIQKEVRFKGLLNIYENEHRLVKKRIFNKEIPLVHCANRASKASEEILELDHIEVGNQILKQFNVRANRTAGDSYIFKRSSIHWGHTNLIVTNQFDDFGNPLFFAHRLNSSVTDIAVYKNDLKVDPSTYKIVDELDKNKTVINKTIVHNFDNSEKEYTLIYFIQGIPYSWLLNTELFFRRTDDFIPEFYSGLNGVLSLYKVIKSKNKLQILLPDDSNEIAIKEEEILIGGFLPPYQFANENWFLEIPRFEFEEGIVYSIPEYNDQSFNPSKPYKRIEGDIGIVKDSKSIYISHKEIQLDKINIMLFKEDESHPSLLLTNDIVLANQVDGTTGLQWQYEPFDISARDYLILSKRSLSNYSFCKASYTIHALSFFVEDLDLNPYLNPSIIGCKCYFYFHPVNGILWFVVDKFGFLKECNNELYSEYIDSIFEKLSPQASTNNLAFYFNLNNDYLKSKLVSEGAKLLALAHQPSFFEEADTVFTKITYQDIPSLEESYSSKQSYLPVADNEITKNKWSVPELKKTYVLKIHWTKLKEYNPSSYITRKGLINQLSKNLPAHVQPVIRMEGVPIIEIKELDLENELGIVRWIPLIKRKEPIAGTVYQSSDNKFYTAAGFISDMSQEKEYVFSLTNEKTYLKIIPRIEVGGETYFGPESNVIYVSKEKLNG